MARSRAAERVARVRKVIGTLPRRMPSGSTTENAVWKTT